MSPSLITGLRSVRRGFCRFRSSGRARQTIGSVPKRSTRNCLEFAALDHPFEDAFHDVLGTNARELSNNRVRDLRVSLEIFDDHLLR